MQRRCGKMIDFIMKTEHFNIKAYFGQNGHLEGDMLRVKRMIWTTPRQLDGRDKHRSSPFWRVPCRGWQPLFALVSPFLPANRVSCLLPAEVYFSEALL